MWKTCALICGRRQKGGGGGERRETRRTTKEGNCHFCFFSLASFPSPFPKHANSTDINNKHTYQVSVVKSTGSLFTSSGAKGKKKQDSICLSLLKHGYCIVGLLPLAKIRLSSSFYLPENSGFPKTCLTTGSESASSAAQPKSIILTFGNGPASKRRFWG